MICPRCGSPVSDGATFCPKCGAAIPVNFQQPNYTPPNGGMNGNNGGNNKSIIIIIVAVVVVLVFIIAAISAFLLVDSSLSKEEPSPTPAPPTAMPTPTQPPVPTAQVIYVPQDNGGGPGGPAQRQEAYEPPYEGGYSTYYSSEYKFACDYPSNFITYDDHGTLTLHTVKSPDGQAVEKIVATSNSGQTVDSSLGEYISSHPGEITYKASGSSYYAINILNGNTEYYKYCKFANGNMYWFEFIYPHSQHDIYDIYINDIYQSFSY